MCKPCQGDGATSFRKVEKRMSAICFALGAVVYAAFGIALTLMQHVPMNEALALLEVPLSEEEAMTIWQAYSPDWQFWNVVRTIACGAALLITGCGLIALKSPSGV